MPDHTPKQAFFHRYATHIWLAYWITLTGLLHSPKLPHVPIRISKDGLVAHFTAFAILTVLCVFARRSRNKFSRRALFLWTFALLAFGATSETVQPLTNRSSDWLDFLANAAGILTVMLIVLKKRLFTPETSPAIALKPTDSD